MICSVGNLFNRVIVQLRSVHLFFVQLLIYSIDFCSVSFLFKSFVQLSLFKTTSIIWQGRQFPFNSALSKHNLDVIRSLLPAVQEAEKTYWESVPQSSESTRQATTAPRARGSGPLSTKTQWLDFLWQIVGDCLPPLLSQLSRTFRRVYGIDPMPSILSTVQPCLLHKNFELWF